MHVHTFYSYFLDICLYRTFLSYLQTVDNKDNKREGEPSCIKLKNALNLVDLKNRTPGKIEKVGII